MNETALHYATTCGSLEIVKYLVEHGAEVNSKTVYDETALHFAAKSGSFETVKYLIEQGAEVTSEDQRGEQTVLYTACLSGNAEIVRYLLAHGAMNDMHKCDNEERSPLFKAYVEDNMDVVGTLLEMGYDIRRNKLEGGNDEITNILQMESKKSIKHRKKIQSLREMDNEKLTKVRYFKKDGH
jgi:ankyrin repeat protein